ncbi:Uncharacterised protein [Mycobacteroides abscessus subsp. bolletii]|uniref:hypothetical protein n=1 Tax=Mycobacteroides abscessus TaxID=36809 RepID=UPI0009D31173|nr:hypothetical protein [Mycobacteroides abscessus]SKG68695.1 Uncharacterised protein [Mycobacteroides abscessus subsp. bolletii]SLF40288.1 Uncharacterised protein [Mycobacteroides abscessus subsp. bolletii]
MPAGKLLAAYAYHVYPQQAADCRGGVIATSAELSAALDSTFNRSQVETAPVVSFQVDTSVGSRAHPIRDVALDVAFATEPIPAAVVLLAQRLADAMDLRSKPALLMVTVHAAAQEDERRFVMWTFPQQEVFSFSATPDETRLEVSEAFVRESNLRKIALVQGNQTQTGMLTARVLDYQTTGLDRTAADLWIVKFLQATLQMGKVEGTKILGNALRRAFDHAAGDHQAQDELSAAIAGLRAKGAKKWSVDQVAREYLGAATTEDLKRGLNADTCAALFDFDPATFDAVVQYKRFTLTNGVIVSAPFVPISSNSSGVEISTTGGKRRLKVDAEIEQEQVRSRG